jgi:raffinose/stachyose/melibiose transport system substrate-binding protein
MKKLLIYVLSIMAILSITACGGNQNSSNTSNSSSKDSEPVTIDIYQFKVEIAEAFEELANEYMKENPNVTINIETVGGGADYGASLRAKMASGNEPTIFNVGGPQDVYDWKDKLVDLSDVPVVKEAFDGATAGVTMDGKVYGIPFTQEGYGFIYNKALFTKAGIDPKTITSFAKLEEAVKTLDSKKSELGIESVFALAGKETWVTGLHFTNVALSPEFENVFNAFNSKTIAFKYSEGMQKLFDLQVKYGKTPVNSVDYSTQVEKLFSLQKVAIMQQGNWTMGAIKGIDEELANNIGFLPMPIIGAKEDSIPVGIPMYWTVNKTKDEKTQKAAKDFLNWMYTSEKGKDYVINKFGFIPPFKGYEAENLQPKDALAKDIMDYSKNGKTIQWVFMGYPSGWGMEKMGVDLQKYVDGKLTWNQVMENGKKSWEEARKK